ncbi:hypothetical protein P6B95_08185 [Streptomyces atratus]|uniref:hypothetical protein n=1 Tax=Streptomyces atratus TaxID=1893 RepID=UPI0016706B97|nr:hypothetical protein [Streptomyces atratus]WPW27361.1 hypothetical protein P6B95_08185 [Streptomyces atratus]GGT51251.1 hypothetical protein GCM10010207_59460 [Streptomyces atratus]
MPIPARTTTVLINRFVRRGVPALALVPLLLAGPAVVRPDHAVADSAPRARTPVQLLTWARTSRSASHGS